MKNYYLIICLLVLGAGITAQAQQKHYTKLEIKAQEVFEVGSENIIYADTLIMHDNSTIRFSPNQKGLLLANAAFIGNKAKILSTGSDGEHGKLGLAATNGTNGGELEVSMHIIKLGSLTINTKGGKGGDGYNGKKGRSIQKRSTQRVAKDSNGNLRMETVSKSIDTRTEGELGTMNGLGGTGGNVALTYYTTPDYTVNIEQNGKERNNNKLPLIKVNTKAGENGKPGKDGSTFIGVTPLTYDLATKTPKQGLTVVNTSANSQDGTITIINTQKATKEIPKEL